MITLYVDDMIIASTQASELNRVVDGLCKEYRMTVLGEPSSILNIHIVRDRDAGTLIIDQASSLCTQAT
jgi:hypothetical protein